MAEKPILLHEEEVIALRNNGVLQVRRPIDPQPQSQIYDDGTNRWYPRGVHGGPDWFSIFKSGDRCWVQEPYAVHGPDDLVVYRADCGEDGDGARWWTTVLMPYMRSRYTVEILAVRAIRLWNYSDLDIVQMGAMHVYDAHYRWDAHNEMKWDTNPFVWAYTMQAVTA